MKKILLVLLFLVIFPKQIWAADNYFEIKIGSSVNKAEITSESEFYLVDEDLNKIHNLGTKKITAELVDNKVVLKSNDKILSSNFPTKGELKIASGSLIKVKNNYRGFFHFEIENSKLNIINTVELEDYLKGVVNNELDASHPMEALKAQAITSRTFAIFNKNKFIKRGFNLTDDTLSQVYKGQSSEKEKTNKAVEETKGIMVTQNSKPISAIFGASSGGKTANAKEVWSGDYSYLISQDDPYSSDYTWNLTLDKSEFIKKISSKFPLSDLYNINISETDSSGRVKNLEIIGDKVYNVKASELRILLGATKVKSTLFNITCSDNIVFDGKGYGHGVGLSQYGASNMAKDGKTYTEILKFYFPGTELSY